MIANDITTDTSVKEREDPATVANHRRLRRPTQISTCACASFQNLHFAPRHTVGEASWIAAAPRRFCPRTQSTDQPHISVAPPCDTHLKNLPINPKNRNGSVNALGLGASRFSRAGFADRPCGLTRGEGFEPIQVILTFRNHQI